ncbi:hypothetical protein L1987_02171 [Smallanthus sonchifolius]|uniref:Uncharacterized protein n=1 Tax=Smallanthus sonchifolius TaxID=185202 RepID=A0ACB9K723_9ASTR|nr:hypothetical protein L1987_02171 [Smallanthus sonchifolius]
MELGAFSWYHALPKAPIKEEYESDRLSQMGGSDFSNWRCIPPHNLVPPPPTYPPSQNSPSPVFPPPTKKFETGYSKKATKPRMRVRELVEKLSIMGYSLDEIYRNLENYESSESEGFLPLPPVEAYSPQSSSYEPFADYLNYLIDDYDPMAEFEATFDDPNAIPEDYNPRATLKHKPTPTYDNVYNDIVLGLRDPPPKFGYPASTLGSPIECLDRSLHETDQVKKELILTREVLIETEKDLSKAKKKLAQKDKEHKSFAKRIWFQGKSLMKDAKSVNFQSHGQFVDWDVRRRRENGYVLSPDDRGEKAMTRRHRLSSHNHDPTQHLKTYSFARKLSQSEYLLVAKLYSQNMLTRNILATIREQNLENRCIKKYIYNAIQKIKTETRVSETPMQVLETMLSSKEYVYYTREDSATNVMEEVAHPQEYLKTMQGIVYRRRLGKFQAFMGSIVSLDRLVGFVDEIVTNQYVQLQYRFGTSLIRKMESHETIELFDNLHGKVSHKALDLLENERYKLPIIRKQNASCGCQLFSSCGLPCACHLEKIEAIDAVDVFRRKLDLKPSFVEDENVDVEKVLGLVRNKIMSQPDQDSRPASSVVKSKKPAMKHSRSMTCKGKHPLDDNGFPLMVGDEAVNITNCFKDFIPSLFHPYISHIQDVMPDGNFGFRSVAVGLGFNEKQWLFYSTTASTGDGR